MSSLNGLKTRHIEPFLQQKPSPVFHSFAPYNAYSIKRKKSDSTYVLGWISDTLRVYLLPKFHILTLLVNKYIYDNNDIGDTMSYSSTAHMVKVVYCPRHDFVQILSFKHIHLQYLLILCSIKKIPILQQCLAYGHS